jgi:hypothetical protein
MDIFEEKLEEVFTDANSDGYELDFISKVSKTND